MKYLVCCDGSEYSSRALDEVLKLANPNDEVILLGVAWMQPFDLFGNYSLEEINRQKLEHMRGIINKAQEKCKASQVRE
jgi:hypothetical protein